MSEEINVRSEERRKRQRAADKKYRLNNPEKCKDKDRKRYEENKESELARNKAYYPTYYEKNKEKIKTGRRNRLHGIDSTWFDAKMAEQDNKCALCRLPFEKTPHVDHDHTCCNTRWCCGQCKRGLLCVDCNLGLGRLKDNIEVLERAIEYLRSYKNELVNKPQLQTDRTTLETTPQ